MDDIIRPRRPAPTGPAPGADAAGVTPRQPAPAAASVHVPEPPVTTSAQPEPALQPEPIQPPEPFTAPEPVAPEAPVAPEPQAVPTPTPEPTAPTETALNLPATEPDGTTNNLGDSLQGSEPVDAPATPAASPSPSLLAEIEAQEARENEAKVTQAPQSSHRKGRWPIILVAIIMALGLIAGAGYAYWQNNKAKPAPAVTSQAKEVVKDPATAEDIDKASTDIDAAIKKIDETKEFQESDLSDTTLGL